MILSSYIDLNDPDPDGFPDRITFNGRDYYPAVEDESDLGESLTIDDCVHIAVVAAISNVAMRLFEKYLKNDTK